MIRYTFVDCGWWCSSGCDCCEDMYIECFNCSSHEIGYSVHSQHDCYVVALCHNNGLETWEGSDDLSIGQLQSMCYEAYISVEIIDGWNG